MREELFYWEEIFYMFWYIDPYYFMLIVPAMLIALLAQARVSSTFNRYSRVYSTAASPPPGGTQYPR